MAQTTNTQSINFRDNNTNCGNITGSFNNTFYKTDEDAQIMRWLSPLEPNIRHQGVRTERYGNVGGWVLETSEFREWSSEGGADKAVLFCSGNPGVGKTYLSSLVIDSLYDQAKKEDIAVACLYYDFLAQQEQTVTNVMGAIIKQLTGRGDIPSYVREAFQESKRIGGRGLLLAEMVQMLRTAIASIPQVYICIDALDECLAKGLPDLLESLRDSVRGFPGARIFLTGRPHVKGDLQRYFPKAVAIPISPNTDDIRAYVKMRLDRDSEPEAMNDDLRADIVEIVLEKISDIFLLVSLNMEAILGEVTIRQRRKKVAEMTRGNGLSDAYTATLSRLKAQKGNKSVLGLKVLMWVSHSERPLRAEELCHALGVEMGSADLDLENVPVSRTLLASCLGLVTVEASSSTIRPVHFTLQEYLSSDPTLFHSPHSTISEVCLTYLNFKSVRDLPPTLDFPPSTMPLLDYASCFWGKHVRREARENAKILAVKLLNRFEEHISARLLLLNRNENGSPGPYFDDNSISTGFTGLHAVAFFGIVGIVTAMFEMNEWDVNATDNTGSTALVWAAARGHEEVVKMLLKRGDVNPDQADTGFGQTPLSWAARYGHEGVVKILLECGDVNPDQVDTEYGQTPLSWAAGQGREGVVRILLEQRDVNANQADTTFGRTPLMWAAGSGHEGAVRMLLERGDVDPDQADTHSGQTPLAWAAEHGREGVVKMLLERGDVNPNQADTWYDQTPLAWATENGHEGVARMLLERGGVDPNQADTHTGRTPLSRAAGSGHETVVKMLLERGDVDPNQADTKYGRTPLSWAAESGHEGVVKMLLELEDVHTATPDYQNQTPLSLALSKEHENIVKILQERDFAKSDPTDQCSHGSLPSSTQNGDERTVEMEPTGGDPKTDITALSGQPRLPPAVADEQEEALDLEDPGLKSADGDPPLNQTIHAAQTPFHPVPEILGPRSKTGTHPNNTRSTLPLPVNQYWAIASSVCLLAFLIYTFASLLPYPFPSHK